MRYKVLVVDDKPENIRVLMEVLEADYAVLAATSGEKAVELASKAPTPDIILLDVGMPGMDGFDVCRTLKSNPVTKHIPVIFVTSLDGSYGEAIGLTVGAVDYVQKPFIPDLVRMRVKNQLELKAYASKMEELAEERAQQLIHADRLASLGTMMAGIIHEINNPLSFMAGNTQILEKTWGRMEECIDCAIEHNPDKVGSFTFLKEELPSLINDMRTGTQRLRGIVNSMKNFSRSVSDEAEEFDLNQCLDEALLICRNALKHNVNLQKDLASEALIVKGSQQQLGQVFVNLIANAADSLEAEASGILSIHTGMEGDDVIAILEDNGPGIPSEVAERIFSPFFTTKSKGKGTGLGLFIAKGIIVEHKGTLEFATPEAGGARFTIRLPKG